tara:strand:- start:117 stop:407 length:291 start_codon:yes stop_codon:yes gene_type:complete
MTEKRKKLIDRFQSWLDTDPRKQIIAAVCANIAEEYTAQQLILTDVVTSKRDETLELLEEIIIKVKEADNEVENGIYNPMLECAKSILNNYKIERR